MNSAPQKILHSDGLQPRQLTHVIATWGWGMHQLLMVPAEAHCATMSYAQSRINHTKESWIVTIFDVVLVHSCQDSFQWN